MSSYTFIRSSQETVAEEATALRRKRTRKANIERTRGASETNRLRRKRAFTERKKCEACAPGEQGNRLTYGRDPLERLEGRVVWVCEKHYKRSYRKINSTPELRERYEFLVARAQPYKE